MGCRGIRAFEACNTIVTADSSRSVVGSQIAWKDAEAEDIIGPSLLMQPCNEKCFRSNQLNDMGSATQEDEDDETSSAISVEQGKPMSLREFIAHCVKTKQPGIGESPGHESRVCKL